MIQAMLLLIIRAVTHGKVGPKLAKLPRGATPFQLPVFSIFLLLLPSDMQGAPEQWRTTV